MSKYFKFIVRRTPNNGCIAHVKVRTTPKGQRMVLSRLTNMSGGPVPDISDIKDAEWETRQSLRAEILNRMRAINPAATGAARQKSYFDRQKAKGLKPVREWIPEGREQEFRAIAKTMIDDSVTALSPEQIHIGMMAVRNYILLCCPQCCLPADSHIERAFELGFNAAFHRMRNQYGHSESTK